MAKILIVEDDVQLSEIVARWLTNEHHVPECVEDGEEALSRLKHYSYELVILDWHSAWHAGYRCSYFFSCLPGAALPVLMLTGKRSVEEKMQGLDGGADDYLTKPFHGKELTARVRALLRRRPVDVLDNILHVGDIELNTVTYQSAPGRESTSNSSPKNLPFCSF